MQEYKDAMEAMFHAEQVFNKVCEEIHSRNAKQIKITPEDITNFMMTLYRPDETYIRLQRKMPDKIANYDFSYVTPEYIAARDAYYKAITQFCKLAEIYCNPQTNE